MIPLPAQAVAPAVLACGGPGRVLGWSPSVGYVQVGRLVVAVTAREVPLMPNGVRVAVPQLPAVRGSAARLTSSRIEAPGVVVAWSWKRPPLWDPSVVPVRAPREVVAERGAAILDALGASPGLSIDPGPLLRGLASRDPGQVADAVAGLVGLGPGLTPEGDDVVAAVAAAVRAFGPSCGLDDSVFLDALRPSRVHERTTALSATLLALALEGQVVDPARRLLDLSDGSWPRALEGLVRVGHSTGPAYAVGIGLAALTMARGAADPADRLTTAFHMGR